MEGIVMKIRSFLPVVMLAVVFAFAGCKSAEETQAGPVDEIEIAAGESIELVSQTMDSGINLIISYE